MAIGLGVWGTAGAELPLSFLSWAYVRQRGLFFSVWYAGGIDFRRTPSVPIFGIISDLLETTKPTSKYARVYIE